MSPWLSLLGLDTSDAPRLVQVIGGGGKTTLMFALAQALHAAGHPVITTTTTRILAPSAAQSPALVLDDDQPGLPHELAYALDRWGQVTLTRTQGPEGKLLGVSTHRIEELLQWRPDARVVAECDGSAGRSLKAHAPHEPVLARSRSVVVAVVGLDILGAPLDAAHVHRAELLARRLGLRPGTTLDAAAVAEAVAGSGGYLDQLPALAEGVLLFTKHTPARASSMRALATAIRAHPAAGRLRSILVADAAEVRRVSGQV